MQSGGGRASSYVPSVYGRQPTADEEEADGASDAEAEAQQASQQYCVGASQESEEGYEDQAGPVRRR